jgi:hypothetical protein
MIVSIWMTAITTFPIGYQQVCYFILPTSCDLISDFVKWSQKRQWWHRIYSKSKVTPRSMGIVFSRNRQRWSFADVGTAIDHVGKPVCRCTTTKPDVWSLSIFFAHLSQIFLLLDQFLLLTDDDQFYINFFVHADAMPGCHARNFYPKFQTLTCVWTLVQESAEAHNNKLIIEYNYYSN